MLKSRFVSLLLVCALLTGAGMCALADEEVSIQDVFPQTNDTAAQQTQPTIQDPAVPSETPLEPTPDPVLTLPDGSVEITISAVGDITIGGDVRKRNNIFENELRKQGGDLSFVMRNVRDILSQDDLTIGNFESTLTTAPVYKTNNSFVFSAPTEYVEILTNGSFEAVSFENNHTMDHGEQGHKETTDTLTNAGIVFSTAEQVGEYETKGVKIAMLSYWQLRERMDSMFVDIPARIAQIRAAYDLIIVSYHWGEELDYYPNANQQKMARISIDAGADLVLGHHSHRVNPIEEYNGKYIVYSLGNFSFSGNNKPSDMSTFIFQARYRLRDGEVLSSAFRIIPARISSKRDYNDFAPTPFTDQTLIDNVIQMLHRNGKQIANPVASYPVDWQ